MNSKLLRILCAVTLTCTLVPTTAFATMSTDLTAGSSTGGAVADGFSDEIAAQLNEGFAASLASIDPITQRTTSQNYADNQVFSDATLQSEDLPSAYTAPHSRVRFQNPWGTCWAFGITAAAETSIKNELGTIDDVDMSEHHLAWFSKTFLPYATDSTQESTCNNQEGEGTHYATETGGERMNDGRGLYGTNCYASGMGIVKETFAPYRGKAGKVTSTKDNDFDSLQACIDAGETPYTYSENDDWSLDEDQRFYQSYQLEESSFLPDVMVKDTDGNYSLDQNALTAAKKELVAGRGIAMGYADDQWMTVGTGRYMNVAKDTTTGDTTYSQYTWEPRAVMHMVCIVGYDDNYSKENFTITNPVRWDSNGRPIYNLLQVDLLNNSEGQPYYIATIDEKKTEVFVDVSNTEFVTKTDRTDANGHAIYQFVPQELTNGTSGVPLIPGTDKTFSGYKTATVADGQLITEAAREEGTYTPEGDGAWLVKNSWGSSAEEFPNAGPGWGSNNEGYFWLSYYDVSAGSFESFDFAVTSEEESQYAYSYVEMYDYMPARWNNAAEFSKKQLEANNFVAEDFYQIKNVSCLTGRPGVTVTYRVYLLDDDAKNPTDGILAAEETATYDYGGYHRTSLTNPVTVRKGQKYSVVTEQTHLVTTESGDTETRWDITASLSNGENYGGIARSEYCVAVVNNGESTLGSTNESGQMEWKDWGTYLTTSEESKAFREYDYAVDNFNIKAYADPVDTVTATFDMQGHGTQVDAQELLVGDTVTEPASPSETGWTFGGWYHDAACTNAWNFATDTVSADTTLYAKWNKTGSGGSDEQGDAANSSSSSPKTGDAIPFVAAFLVITILGAGTALVYLRRRDA